MIEKMHSNIENIFDVELHKEPEVSAITNFFARTVHFTKYVHNHFIAKADKSNGTKTGHSLLIADKFVEAALAKQKRNKRYPAVTVVLVPTDTAHKRRMLTLKVDEDVNVRKQRYRVQPAKNNIVINDIRVSPQHATLRVTKKQIIEIRDNGSNDGTFLNGHRLSSSGVVSPCFILKHNDIVTFGLVEFKVIVLRPATQNAPADTDLTDSVAVTLRTEHGDDLPERNVRLFKNRAVIIGQATKRNPAIRANTLFQFKFIGPRHAHIAWTGSNFYIKSLSKT